jgi:predicted secreted hydrolase
VNSRRHLVRLATSLAGLAGLGVTPRLAAEAFPGRAFRHPTADPAYRMTFPRDFGAHPGFRTEWWYVTGWLRDGPGDRESQARIEGDASAGARAPGRYNPRREDRGFQVTFFRVRTDHPQENPSRFAPTELLFAHAALMLPSNAHALHGQRAARIGAPGVHFSEQDADVAIGNWSLVRGQDDRYRTMIHDDAFRLDLTLSPPGQPGEAINQPWLQGASGFSRKGPLPEQASHYYSRPQMQISGTVDARPVSGIAWFDHEWSTTVLDASAAGWDWTGINLDDGSALVAFRIRRRRSQAAAEGNGGSASEQDADRGTAKQAEAEPLWHYCALRHADGRTEVIESIRFEVLRRWQSPRTMATYPVAMKLRLKDRSLRLEPLFDDQELDGRGSTGTIYWEGAVRVIADDGAQAGLGYLELTGYHAPLKL